MSKNGDSKIVFSWYGNLPVNIPIFFAVFGFIAAIIILDTKGCKSDAIYHDLYLTNKEQIVYDILQKRIGLLNAKADTLNARKAREQALAPKKKPAPVKDKVEKSTADETSKNKTDTLVLIKAALALSQKELNNLKNYNADTSLKLFLNYFSLNRDLFRDALTDERNEGCDHVTNGITVAVKDTFSIINNTGPQYATLQIGTGSKKTSLIKFFEKYPNFGFWFLLSIAQMTIWFLLVPLVVGNVQKSNNVVKEFPYTFRNGFILSIIPIIVIGLFVWLLYFRLIDTYIISDCYFLDGFVNRMYWYSIPGYVVTVLCFGVYLFLANKLQFLNELSDTTKLAENTKLQNEYKSLRSAFNFTFLGTAIILSMFVLWIGVLFNSLNSIEAFRFYMLLSGKPFFDYNFVYFIGLIHTIILLIFYIPVRLQFNSLEITQEQKSIDEVNDSPSKKAFKTFWESIGVVLLTASPLITTILEKAISNLLD